MPCHAMTELAHADDLGLQRPAAGKSRKLAGQLGTPANARQCVGNLTFRAFIAGDSIGKQMEVSGDHRRAGQCPKNPRRW